MDEENVVLMMPVVKGTQVEATFHTSSGIGDAIEMLPVSYEAIAGFAKTFEAFELDIIEVHVKGIAKSCNLTQLIMGLEGEAGMKIILKKKN